VDDREGAVPKLKPAVYRAIIDEAHKNGMQVLAHLSRTSALADAKDLFQASRSKGTSREMGDDRGQVGSSQDDDAILAACRAEAIVKQPAAGVWPPDAAMTARGV